MAFNFEPKKVTGCHPLFNHIKSHWDNSIKKWKFSDQNPHSKFFLKKMIKIDLAGASAMDESYSIIENQGYIAAFVDRTILKNVSTPQSESVKESVTKL